MRNDIYPCLWFSGNAAEAANFYCQVFPNSEIIDSTSLVTSFKSFGQRFMCLNGGPEFQFNPSVSFFVLCETEAEVDDIWTKLLHGGSILMDLDKYDWSSKYGWLQDKYEVTWQIALGKLQDVGQKFTPSLLFVDNQHGKAIEAIEYYTSIFPDSSIMGIQRFGKNEHEKEGTVKHGQFKLGNTVFMVMDSALNHKFSFNEAISFVVECNNQEEIDYYWNKLTDGGQEVQCGWLKDRFGISWQVIPKVLESLMKDPQRSERVVKAFLKMKKFEIDKLITA